MKLPQRKFVIGGLLLAVALGVFLAVIRGCFIVEGGGAQISAKVWPGYQCRAKALVAPRLIELERLAPLAGGVLFIGDSITQFAPLDSMFLGASIANYGVSGGTSEGLLLRLDQITRNAPDRVMVLIGTNDIHYRHKPKRIAGNIVSALAALKQNMPDTEFYVMSILPREAGSMTKVRAANAILKENAAATGYAYLDLTPVFAGADGALRADLTRDGLHLNAAGYAVLAKAIGPCVVSGCAVVPQ